MAGKKRREITVRVQDSRPETIETGLKQSRPEGTTELPPWIPTYGSLVCLRGKNEGGTAYQSVMDRDGQVWVAVDLSDVISLLLARAKPDWRWIPLDDLEEPPPPLSLRYGEEWPEELRVLPSKATCRRRIPRGE